MAYADFTFYQGEYFGDTLTAENAVKWLSMASDELDTLTFGRLTFAFPTVEAHEKRVKKAVCAVADSLCMIDAQKKAAAAQQTTDGSYRNAVASVSSGRESVSYAVNAVSSVYAAAAADAHQQANLIRSVTAQYLANIPDANGVNLLYAGGAPCTKPH